MAHAVSCSSPTTGVLSLHLDHSMWVSWWRKQGLGRFLSRCTPKYLTLSLYAITVLFIVMGVGFRGLRLVKIMASVLSKFSFILHLEHQVSSLFKCI